MNPKDNIPQRPENSRRKKRSRMQNFREAYLPVIVAALVVVLLLIWVIGAIRNSLINKEEARASSIAEAASLAENQARLDAEAAQLLKDASYLADTYDYDAAITKLDGFYNNMIYEYDDLLALRDRCVLAKENLVTWSDPGEIVNLSIHMLVADPVRAFNHPGYKETLYNSYLTTEEFSALLEQLYNNNYVLVQMSDIFKDGENGLITNGIYLPEGKKPIMLTQSHANYYKYLIDGDEDGLPDANGSGFASKMVLDANGNITCEMVDASGNVVTGAFDIVPILDAFIEKHPDFSYRGSKATVSVTGYDGLFGYRTDSATKEAMGEDYYNQQVAGAVAIANALQESGYEIACYTYEHGAYGEMTEWSLTEDLKLWNEEVVPIVGKIDTLVFAKGSDIEAHGPYTGEKFNILFQNGFRYFLGFVDDAPSFTTHWGTNAGSYVRQARLLVYGEALLNNPEWYDGIFDPAALLAYRQ